nr:hypothetical protein [uncultured Rhodoferax sp.]
MALMLQRKSNSSIGMRAYLVDSGVMAAGASSVALALVLTTQYAMAVYDYKEYVVSVLVFNWGWLAVNLVLTGNFLARTIHFLNEDENQLSLKRLAVNVALWAEWVYSTKQQLFAAAPATIWAQVSQDGAGPSIEANSFGRPMIPVFRRIWGTQKLHDIHMGLLKVVLWSWCRRASKGHKVGRYKEPKLLFSAQVGRAYSSKVQLCGVSDGPALNAVEAYLLGCAFVFSKTTPSGNPPSTQLMLRELASEVEVFSEGLKYRQGKEAFNRLLEFHRVLLKAVQEPSRAPLNDRSYLTNSISTDWLDPYFDLCQIAVARIEQDRQLFRDLAHIPSRLSISLSPLDEVRIVESMKVGTYLGYRLEAWWIRQADASGLSDGLLPTLQNREYGRALVEFVGAWNTFRVVMPSAEGTSDEMHWQLLCARARIYTTHIEKSAELFLDAVSRGDAAASEWLCDAFLKWWGTRVVELMPDKRGREPDYRDAALSVVELDWNTAKERFQDDQFPWTPDLAARLVGHAVRNYWESMRVLLLLLLIENVPAGVTATSREVQFIAKILKKQRLKPGGEVNAVDLESRDSVWAAMLKASFGDVEVSRHLDGFVERLRWDKQIPEVPGWTYMWSGGPEEIETKKLQFAQLLAVCSEVTGESTPAAKKITESFWRDTEKLQYIASFFRDVHRVYSTQEFADAQNTVDVLRQALERPVGAVHACTQAKNQALALGKVALHERELTLQCRAIDLKLVQAIGRFVSKTCFERVGIAATPFKRVVMNQQLSAPKLIVSEGYPKEQLERQKTGVEQDSWTDHIAEIIWTAAKGSAIGDYISRSNLTAYKLTDMLRSDAPSESEVTATLRAIVADAEALRTTGRLPVVLVSGVSSFFDSPYGWRDDLYGKAPPSDIRIERGIQSDVHGVYSQINATPILQAELGRDLCCVLPWDVLDTISVGGPDASSALKVEHRELGTEYIALDFTFCVRAGHGSANSDQAVTEVETV